MTGSEGNSAGALAGVFLATLAVPAGQWETLFHPKMLINISQQIEEERRKTENKRKNIEGMREREKVGEKEGRKRLHVYPGVFLKLCSYLPLIQTTFLPPLRSTGWITISPEPS